ncbi:Helix-turn-helix domain-containing protein [Rhizobiales bacterium GAS191]|nr:Helix-turn-helix domain-containing protein [Rhizobiales bacterium GAS191]
MEWATDIFSIENRTERSGFVRRIWRARSVEIPSFISVAVPTWQIVFIQSANGSKSVVARGPETLATRVNIPKDAEFLGIQFELGAFLPDNTVGRLVDNAESLSADSDHSFWLNDTKFEIPTFENAEVLVDHLIRSGGLVRDTVVEQTLQRRPVSLSDRSIQRRFINSTGLTYGAVRQMERAEHAASLLRNGVSILDVVDGQGYSDQAHLTRSLKRYLGTAPGRIAKADR